MSVELRFSDGTSIAGSLSVTPIVANGGTATVANTVLVTSSGSTVFALDNVGGSVFTIAANQASITVVKLQ